MEIKFNGSMSLASFCRICLEEGGTYHIFDNLNIQSKLLLCMREKIDNIEWFPDKICEKCKDTLDTVYNFINKYKDSTKALNTMIFKIKVEPEDENVEIDAAKLESDQDLNPDYEYLTPFKPLQDAIKKFKPNGIKREIKKKPIKSTGKKKETGAKKKTLPRTKKLPSDSTKPETKNYPPTLRPSLCDECGMSFENVTLLSSHKYSKHKPKVDKVKCTICGNTYCDAINLERHRQRMHGGDKKFPCPRCNSKFALKGDLSAHINNKHNRHLKPKKSYSCEYCNKQYTSQAAHIGHVRSMHTGERPEECKVCGKCFFVRSYLREHMRLHTGATPFKCPICERGYAQCGNMKSHLRNHKISDVSEETLKKIRPSYLKYMRP